MDYKQLYCDGCGEPKPEAFLTTVYNQKTGNYQDLCDDCLEELEEEK